MRTEIRRKECRRNGGDDPEETGEGSADARETVQCK
jgi:hypothetical protein